MIACEVDADGNKVAGEGKGLAERAYHPEEVNANPSLRVDTDYYLAQQVSWAGRPGRANGWGA